MSRGHWTWMGAGLVVVALAGAAVALALSAPDVDRISVVSAPVEARQQAPEGAPNVVMIVLCTLRLDQTSFSEEGLQTTPWLAGFASEGLRFADTIAAAPWTRPATVALITGHHPISVGMTEPRKGMNRRALRPEVTTLAERFAGAGWRTLGGSANPNVSSHFLMHQGFDAFAEPALRWHEGGLKISGDTLNEAAFQALDADADDSPVFLQLMYVDAHAPRTERWWDWTDVEPALRDYRAALGELDAHLAQLHEGLQARGFTDENTLFVVVSDHGEGLGVPAGVGMGHGRRIRPQLVQGLWLMRGAGVGRGLLAEGLASQVDVSPTIAALAGLPGWEAAGMDLSAVVPAGGQTGRLRAYSDTWFKEEDEAAVFTGEHACLIDGPYSQQCHARGRPWSEPSLLDHALVMELRAWRARRIAEGEGAGEPVRINQEGALAEQLEALGYVE